MHRRHIAAAGVLALGMMLPLTDGLAAELPGPVQVSAASRMRVRTSQ